MNEGIIQRKASEKINKTNKLNSILATGL